MKTSENVMNTLSAKWKQHIGAAKTAWGKLTDDQLLETEGQHQKLVGLIEEQYNISREEADKQVKAFTKKHFH
ncbi:MAG: CsbD family protein [Nitrincola lacisaponensis]|uniref:CsbD family protein n=1 Tax=Nitrincola lacisaponensis TaxID=267850 RepID=UPI003918B52A